MAAEFVLNPLGIVALLDSPELAADMNRRVNAIADEVRRTAPVSDRPEDQDHYRDNINAGTMIAEFTGRFGNDSRVTGYVQAAVPWACAVEVRHRTLGTALSGNQDG